MVRILLRFSKGIIDKPITSQVIREERVTINILSAHIDPQGGEILADISSDQAENAIRAFREKGVVVDVRKLIEKDDEKCTDCGACVSLCPVDAIIFENDFSVEIDEERCIGVTCGLCVDACPARAIRLIG